MQGAAVFRRPSRLVPMMSLMAHRSFFKICSEYALSFMRLLHARLRWLILLLCLGGVLPGSRAFAAAVAQPAIQLKYGTASAQYQAQISCVTPGAVIHYSITGLDPTTSDAVVTSGSVITITQNVILKASAWDGNTPATLTPSLVATQVCNVFGRVAAGDDDTVVLKSDGRAWASGLNSSGQLGDGTLTNRTAPVSVMKVAGTVLKTVVSVDGGPGNGSGVEHTVAALSDGTVRAWGSNSNGQLGNTPTGTPADSQYPVQVVTAGGSALGNVVTYLAQLSR